MLDDLEFRGPVPWSYARDEDPVELLVRALRRLAVVAALLAIVVCVALALDRAGIPTAPLRTAATTVSAP